MSTQGRQDTPVSPDTETNSASTTPWPWFTVVFSYNSTTNNIEYGNSEPPPATPVPLPPTESPISRSFYETERVVTVDRDKEGVVRRTSVRTKIITKSVEISPGGPTLTSDVAGNTTFKGLMISSIQLIVANFVNIIMIAIGSVYFADCPAEPHLTSILISVGAICVLCSFLGSCIKVTNSKFLRSLNLLFAAILCTLLVYACAIPYSLYTRGGVNYEEDAVTLAQDFCHKFVFRTFSTFIVVIVGTIVYTCYFYYI